MAYQIPIKYFNAFWIKKVVGDSDLDPKAYIEAQGETWTGESTVTTSINAGSKGYGQDGSPSPYMLPTWPGLPWGKFLSKPNSKDPSIINNYPCFPFGGRLQKEECGGSLISRDPDRESGQERQWAIEEARIRGGYNNTTVDFGVKAYLVEGVNTMSHKTSGIIYSGIFNSKTGINNTNVFNMGEPITKALDPAQGSIQRLYAYDTNLTIFQENKVSKALIDKDAIYSAEGVGTPVTSTKVVIGQIVPYVGEYGISKNPESWCQYGFRQYFSDRFRNAIMRLSRDGLTEISAYGMTDYFRDELSILSDSKVKHVTSFSFDPNLQWPNSSVNLNDDFNWIVLDPGKNGCNCSDIRLGSLIQIIGNAPNDLYVDDIVCGTDQIVIHLNRGFRFTEFGLVQAPSQIGLVDSAYNKVQGGFDTHNKNYVVSLQKFESNTSCNMTSVYSTLNFDETINGWVSFYDYEPTLIDSLKNNYYTIKDSSIYSHYAEGENNYLTFYGQSVRASINFIFNPKPSIIKNFQTIGYEGSNGWEVTVYDSDNTEFLRSNNQWFTSSDTASGISSYLEGAYISDTGNEEHAGFYRKENLYVANLINDSENIVPGQVIPANQNMSGVKGYFVTVALSSDLTTLPNSFKELYAVTSKYVVSSK